MTEPVVICGETIQPGESRTVNVELPGLYTQAETFMPVHVIHGKRSGPRLFVSAVIHGDELNGMEIIRRVLRQKGLARLHGTLIAVPVVNVYGCLNRSRYLPDGRDLNRSFPGSPRGSMASRLAHLFMNEIVAGSDYGIDLHTAGGHRDNLPHLRTAPEVATTMAMAQAFGAPVVLDADIIDNSLRHAALEVGVPLLLYEGGAALRYNERAIRAGVYGIMGVMRKIGMLRPSRKRKIVEPLVARRSGWVRAPSSGVFRSGRKLGDVVSKGDALGYISHPLSSDEEPIEANRSGVIIGSSLLPLVHEGEAVFHIAVLEDPEAADGVLDNYHEAHAAGQDPDGEDNDELLDE